MRVTFLESSHGIRLTKTISKTESKSYPDVKTVTSTEYDVPVDGNWTAQFAALLAKHGALGHCLLKGPLKKPAVNESRAGLSDKVAYSDLLVLDIDNLKIPRGMFSVPMQSADVKRIADMILCQVDDQLKDVSYVAQASSSLGRKPEHVSLHIFVALDTPLPPKTLKLWLKHINQSISLFKDQMSLSATGQALKYPLDPSVADNSKLIFISPPDFTEPGLDPFASAQDRIAIVNRPETTFDLATAVSSMSPEKVHEEGIEIKEALRDRSGLKKRKGIYTSVNLQGENIELLTNPDKMSIAIVAREGNYVRCNINGGDSGAYYFRANDPQYMFNFKDEPAFEIEKADKDFYETIFEEFKNAPVGEGHTRPLQPIVLRDFATDTLYNGIFDPNAGRFSDSYPLTPTSAGAIEGFMRSHGQAAPSFVPDAKVVFDPPRGDQKPNLDTIPYYVNLYRPSEIQDAATPPEVRLSYASAHDLVLHCPKIYTLIKHICGDGLDETQHFINWLAYIYQYRNKSMTAWVFGGVPGTGKGAFVNQILRPLFGQSHVTMKALENLEEQFNNFMRTAMFLVVDEFQMSASKGGATGATRMADKLKNQITEPTLSIRSMRSNQIELPSYTNFIFLTNRPDAVKIEAGDRRYNICPRQEKKLIDVHPHIVRSFTDEKNNISSELTNFAGALSTFKVDVQAARTCLANDAKETMKAVSASVIEDFASAFTSGNLRPLLDVLDVELVDTFNAQRIVNAQKIVRSWVLDAAYNRPSVANTEQLRAVFHVLNGGTNELSPKEFAKRLTRFQLDARNHRVNGDMVRGVKFTFTPTEEALKEITDTYFKDPTDKALLPRKTA